jgi:hypothetical protein
MNARRTLAERLPYIHHCTCYYRSAGIPRESGYFLECQLKCKDDILNRDILNRLESETYLKRSLDAMDKQGHYCLVSLMWMKIGSNDIATQVPGVS